jgi:hypothetical protein
MAERFASGKKAIAVCDRCGFQYKLKQLKPLTIKTKQVNIMVCPTCWEPDQPQLSLGMYVVEDPQALRNPRPDNTYSESRTIQWGWAPVGGNRTINSPLTPNNLVLNIALGTVTVDTTGGGSLFSASVSETVAGSVTSSLAVGKSVTVAETASVSEEVSSTIETLTPTFDSTNSKFDSTNNTFDEA